MWKLLARRPFEYGLRPCLLVSRTRAQYSNTAIPKIKNVGFGEFCADLFHSGIVQTQASLEALHSSTGLPWWGCIIIGASAARLLILPIRIYALQQSLLLGQANQAVARQAPTLRAATKDPRKLRAELGKSWVMEMRERGTHPFRMLLPVALHVPLFLALGGALRRMSDIPFWGVGEDRLGGAVEGWSTEGLLFFTDLAVTNPLLTVITVVSNLLTIEWIFRTRPATIAKALETKPVHKMPLYWLMHGLGGISAVILWFLPAGINFFVFIANVLAVTEGVAVLRARWLHKFLSKRLPLEKSHIYRVRSQ